MDLRAKPLAKLASLREEQLQQEKRIEELTKAAGDLRRGHEGSQCGMIIRKSSSARKKIHSRRLLGCALR